MIRKFFNTDEKESAGDVQGSATNSAGLSDLDQEIIKERYSSSAVSKIMDFRLRLDSLYLTVKTLQPSRAISLAVTALQTARQATGLMLGEKGRENPYPTSTDPNNKEIGERADKGELIKEVEELPEEIAKIKKLRAIMADLVTDVTVYLTDMTPASVVDYIAQTEMAKGLLWGKIWLGERLGEIHESQKESTKQ